MLESPEIGVNPKGYLGPTPIFYIPMTITARPCPSLISVSTFLWNLEDE